MHRARFARATFCSSQRRHGDAYVEKFQVLQDPAATSELCGFFATHGRETGGENLLVDLVAGPTTGGIILAFETARQLGVRSIFAEEVRADDGTLSRAFRRGFRIEPGERVLLVDDILTTGGSLLAMLPAVEAMGGEIVECVVLVDRSGGRSTLTSPATGRTLCAAVTLAAGSAHLRARPRDLPALRRSHAPPRTGQFRHGDERTDHDSRLTPEQHGSADADSLCARTRGDRRSDRWSGAAARRNRQPRPGSATGGAVTCRGDRRAWTRRASPTSAASPFERATAPRPPLTSAPSRTARSSRRATSSSTSRLPSRSGSGTGRKMAGKWRSGSRTQPDASFVSRDGERQPAAMTGKIASSSAGVIVTSYEPRTTPFRSTAKIHGSESRPHWLVMSVAWSCVVGVEDRLQGTVHVLELVRLDVDERDLRVRRRDRLEVVEGRPALRARTELGGREDEHEGLVCRRAHPRRTSCRRPGPGSCRSRSS